jgi:hypothetical protein
MPFAYYDRLSPSRQRIYRRSDAILEVPLPDAAALVPLAAAIEPVLATGDPKPVQAACQRLVDALNAQLATPPVRMRVLERRPSDAGGELHGLYEPEDGGKVARVSVWMRTAARDEVVKYRTLLRTVLHEMCHHFDYELFGLAETFHTQGFYARESTLLTALAGAAPARGGAARRSPPASSGS